MPKCLELVLCELASFETSLNIVTFSPGCTPPVNVLAIVLGVILGIILIGLALLIIWKVLVTIHDRREFARFEKERENAKWDMVRLPLCFILFSRAM